MIKFINDRFEEIIGGILLSLVVLLTFIGVVARLVFSSGLPWQEELTRMLFVLMVYFGASYSVLKVDHIRITLVLDLLPPSASWYLDRFADIAAIAFQLTLCWLAYLEVVSMSEFPAYSGVLQIPLHLIFAIVPTMFFLMAIRQAQRLWIGVQERRQERNV